MATLADILKAWEAFQPTVPLSYLVAARNAARELR